MTRRRKNLSNAERQAIYEALLEESITGKLKNGSFSNVASRFDVCQKTVRRLWNEAKRQVSEGCRVDLSSKINQIGRKRVQISPEAVSKVPLRLRSNIRSLAKALSVTKSLLHRRIKKGVLIRHSNAIKPVLTDSNRRARLSFCLSMVDRSVCSPSNPVFNAQFNMIHIDEKWFYMTKATKRYYLLPSEDEPVRSCKSKKFITKIMFLAAVARPRFDQVSGEQQFDGKLGIFPFTELQPAQRCSKNRPTGTLQTKPICVTKQVTRAWLINKVLPAIIAKWPVDHEGPIWIQQDNAKPHLDVNEKEFGEAVAATGLDIRLCFQPPNSPDLNVLDLGFFRAIQSLQEQQVMRNIDELIAAVQRSYESMPVSDLNKVFLTLQCCMKEILKSNGGNNYRIPHIGKGRLENDRLLPLQIECEQTLIEAVSHVLEE